MMEMCKSLEMEWIDVSISSSVGESLLDGSHCKAEYEFEGECKLIE